ncbi:HAMP domain-containing sensor histidine kinase [Streptomyces sp. NPDC001941]|uniref:sensor histidine kinase n=1 Tax=Streptomyces sp. NPDC001941 TaxID=3154659 RepID=UPI003330EE46
MRFRLPHAVPRTVRAPSFPGRRVSLRWKIAALLAGGCALVAVAIGLLIHQARTDQVVSAARSSAVAQLVRVRQLYVLTGTVDREDTASELDCPGLPAALRASARAGQRNTYVRLGGPAPAVWAARPVGNQVLSVRLPLTEERAELAELDRKLVAFGIVVVALAALGGAALSSRLSRELRTAAATARRISQGELDARIGGYGDVPAGGAGPLPPDERSPRAYGRHRPDREAGEVACGNEVAELASAVDTMAASLQQRIEAEQRFTADVAHELRTPLTGLHTAAELLPPGRPTELVRDRVAALRTLTEDLLEVARLDADAERPEMDVHPLGPLTHKIVRGCGFTAEFESTEPTLVRTDARRLERIVANLLVNARRHGGDPVEVLIDGTRVTVRDHGPGFPGHLLENGPQRFLTGAAERGQGTGLGLTIALGQAQVIGARVELANAPDGGAMATVVLPGAVLGEEGG